ncbi:hypothetical protein KP509_06G040300 [Ceratopteris richardii]|uniref:Peptidase A1 domain-containing protein n=1 Tax=Ceratopteris richardii TaxID=49495 RepID=A0A8T2UHE3_CERRI|nr:hypothetical protein KP509_06G040300 [Ceratopteris richardii]
MELTSRRSNGRRCAILTLWVLALMNFSGMLQLVQADRKQGSAPWIGEETRTARLLHRDAPGSPFREEKVSNADLCASRLARDEARVRYLYAAGAVESNHGGSFEYHAPVHSGNSLTGIGDGEYFTTVGLGSGSKQYAMILDTASSLTWLQCSSGKRCSKQLDSSSFDPSASATFRNVSCASPLCSSFGNCSAVTAGGDGGQCFYSVKYGEDSLRTGRLVTDTFFLGESSVSGMAFGCASAEVMAGLGGAAAGSLALGAGPLAFPSQLAAQRGEDTHIKSGATFCYCLPSVSSAASFLSFKSPRQLPIESPSYPLSPPSQNGNQPTSPIFISMSILKNSFFPMYYYVPLIGISVGGEPLLFPADVFAMDPVTGRGGVVIDTVYHDMSFTFRTAVSESPVAARVLRPAPPTAELDTCYHVNSSDMSTLNTYPTDIPSIQLRFAGGDLTLPTENVLLVKNDSANPILVCLAFSPPASTAPFYILGNVQQQGFRLTYDSGNILTVEGPRHC